MSCTHPLIRLYIHSDVATHSDYLQLAEELASPIIDQIRALRSAECNDHKPTRGEKIVRLLQQLKEEIAREEAQSRAAEEKDTNELSDTTKEENAPSNREVVIHQGVENEEDSDDEEIVIALTKDKGKDREISNTPITEVEEAKLRRQESQAGLADAIVNIVRFTAGRDHIHSDSTLR